MNLLNLLFLFSQFTLADTFSATYLKTQSAVGAPQRELLFEFKACFEQVKNQKLTNFKYYNHTNGHQTAPTVLVGHQGCLVTRSIVLFNRQMNEHQKHLLFEYELADLNIKKVIQFTLNLLNMDDSVLFSKLLKPATAGNFAPPSFYPAGSIKLVKSHADGELQKLDGLLLWVLPDKKIRVLIQGQLAIIPTQAYESACGATIYEGKNKDLNELQIRYIDFSTSHCDLKIKNTATINTSSSQATFIEE